MTMRVYHLKTCDTCRKAIRALKDAGKEIDLVDVRADGIPAGTLSMFVTARGRDVFLNKRSTTWRELDDADREDIDDGKAVDLMLRHPTLMKRPVIEHDGDIHVGWTPQTKAALL